MARKLGMLVSGLVAAVACKAGGQPKETATAAPAAAKPAPAVVQPAEVTAAVRGTDADGPPTAVFRVTMAGTVQELVLPSDFEGCESVDASVDEVEALGDARLRMAQLFCESGEDYFSRTMITALLLVGPDPRLLWQGRGSYANSMGTCEEIDVLHFRRGGAGKVEAVRTTEVIAEGEHEDGLCEAQAEQQEVVATIDVPAP